MIAGQVWDMNFDSQTTVVDVHMRRLRVKDWAAQPHHAWHGWIAAAEPVYELRTPINNMRGEAEVALSRARSVEEYRESLTSCLEENVRLSALIASLLFLARAESPGTHLEREPVRVIKELGSVRDYYEAAAAEAEIRLSVAARDEVILGLDRGLLRQAIGKMVANAIAHTPKGGTVTLTAGLDQGDVRIEVSDTGKGIPAQDLPRVFDAFIESTKPARHRVTWAWA